MNAGHLRWPFSPVKFAERAPSRGLGRGLVGTVDEVVLDCVVVATAIENVVVASLLSSPAGARFFTLRRSISSCVKNDHLPSSCTGILVSINNVSMGSAASVVAAIACEIRQTSTSNSAAHRAWSGRRGIRRGGDERTGDITKLPGSGGGLDAIILRLQGTWMTFAGTSLCVTTWATSVWIPIGRVRQADQAVFSSTNNVSSRGRGQTFRIRCLTTVGQSGARLAAQRMYLLLYCASSGPEG